MRVQQNLRRLVRNQHVFQLGDAVLQAQFVALEPLGFQLILAVGGHPLDPLVELTVLLPQYGKTGTDLIGRVGFHPLSSIHTRHEPWG